MQTAYILAAYRTPACRAYKGKFKEMRPDDLAAAAIRGLVERTGIAAEQIEDVILGCAFPEAEQGWDVARVAALRAGLPSAIPGMTVNRLCSSGLQSIAQAADRVIAGQAHCILAGGVESMTCIPLGGHKFAPNPGMVADYPEAFLSMGLTAERVAELYGVSRELMDEYAAGSHRKAFQALSAGRFVDETIPVDVEHAILIRGTMQREIETVLNDDGVRGETTVEALAELKPAFKRDGTVTAGNASQMTDGAAAALVVSEEFLKRSGRNPAARFVGYAVRGVPPEIMGIGPVEAIPAVLAQAGLQLQDLGLIELNEAFAAQVLAVSAALDLDMARVNVNGGAIALGHPLGATGAKLTATLLSEMTRREVRYGMVTMCIGLGMGAAGIFERC